MTDQSVEEIVREGKITHAIKWVNDQLRMHGGPHPGRSAVVILTLDPVDGDPEAAYVNIRALPDVAPLPLADALEQLAKDIRANNVEWTPHEREEATH